MILKSLIAGCFTSEPLSGGRKTGRLPPVSDCPDHTEFHPSRTTENLSADRTGWPDSWYSGSPATDSALLTTGQWFLPPPAAAILRLVGDKSVSHRDARSHTGGSR